MFRLMGVGQDIVDDRQKIDYCENLPAGACATSQAVLDYAKSKCPTTPRVRGFDTRGGLRGLGKICSVYSNRIGIDSAHWWNPCVLKTLPICGPKPPPVVTEEPQTPLVPVFVPEEEPETPEDEGRQYVVGGLLALVVAGGAGYAIWRNRKRRKGKRRKR